MKWKFTYKELSLLLGIVVAVIIMITLWLKPFSLESGEVSEKPAQKIIVPAAKILAERTYVLVTEILR
jgi:hypothetical protein